MRKVGDVFWTEWKQDLYSTSSDESRIKYKVVEIVNIGNFGEGTPVERLQPLKVETRSPHANR